MERVRVQRLNLKKTAGLSVALLAASTFGVYYFCPDSRVQVLACEGNYLYTDQQIYDMAGVSSATRLWLEPSFVMTSKVARNPLISSVKVTKSGSRLSFQVKEKMVIGYYVENGKNYMLTSDDQSVPLESAYLRNIIHYPLLSDFTADQRSQIAKQFADHPDLLTQQIVAQIAEIVPYKASYDDNMLRITMQDGNVIFSSMDDLVMMTHYEAMLSQLKGQSVCLLLDKDNSAINKVACDYLYMSQEERQAYQDELKAQREQAAKEKEQAEAAKKAETHTEDGESQPESVNASDWEESDAFDYLYSPSLDLYQDPSTGQYLRWSEESQDFMVVETVQ